jgi:DNA-binding transcriptional ArsR family regulator
MGDPVAKADLYDALARVGKALGSGKRLELLDLLAQGERSVDALAAAAGLGLTTASGHLQTLKQAGPVATRREGTCIHYRLAGPDVAALYTRLRDLAGARSPQAAAARDTYLGPNDTQHLTRDELLRRARTGHVTVLDVRPAAEYAAGHIPGALSIPSTNSKPDSPTWPPTPTSSPTAAAPTASWPTTPSAYSPSTAAAPPASSTACSNGVSPTSPSRPHDQPDAHRRRHTSAASPTETTSAAPTVHDDSVRTPNSRSDSPPPGQSPPPSVPPACLPSACPSPASPDSPDAAVPLGVAGAPAGSVERWVSVDDRCTATPTANSAAEASCGSANTSGSDPARRPVWVLIGKAFRAASSPDTKRRTVDLQPDLKVKPGPEPARGPPSRPPAGSAAAQVVRWPAPRGSPRRWRLGWAGHLVRVCRGSPVNRRPCPLSRPASASAPSPAVCGRA